MSCHSYQLAIVSRCRVLHDRLAQAIKERLSINDSRVGWGRTREGWQQRICLLSPPQGRGWAPGKKTAITSYDTYTAHYLGVCFPILLIYYLAPIWKVFVEGESESVNVCVWVDEQVQLYFVRACVCVCVCMFLLGFSYCVMVVHWEVLMVYHSTCFLSCLFRLPKHCSDVWPWIHWFRPELQLPIPW